MSSPGSGDAGSPSSIPNDILTKQKQGQAIMIWAIGAFCVYGWELILCAPKEYRLVWKKPLNVSSIIYLVNRYFGLFEFCFIISLLTDAWSPSACKRIFLIEPIGALITTILSQAILAGRVYAIYGRSKVLASILGVILVVEAVIGVISSSKSSPPPQIPFAPPGSQPPCGALTGPLGWVTVYWTMPLLFDLVTFLLTAWKAYDLWRREVNTPIFNIIWRDGLLYFAAIFAMNTINVIIFVAAPSTLRDFNLAPTNIFQVIISCRMFLKLKGSGDLVDSQRDGRHLNITDRLKFRSYVSSGTVTKDGSRGSGTPTAFSSIPVDTKRATVAAQDYELDAQDKPPHQTWDMA